MSTSCGDVAWAACMDWCKKMGTSPASHNELFAIVTAVRKAEAALSPPAPQGVAEVMKMVGNLPYRRKEGSGLWEYDAIEKAITALVQERDALKARVAELQARNSKLVQILADIHELLNPPPVEHEGKTYRFVNRDANAVLEELSSRIRAIPDSIDALPNEQGGHIARLEKDAARYRWLKLQPWNMWGPNVGSGPRSEHVGNLDAAIDAAIAASKEAS